jgi:hypothetical protein
MVLRRLVGSALVCVICPVAAVAQNVLELIPFGGSYVPLTAFGEAHTAALGSDGAPLRSSEYRQTIGVTLGMRLRWSLSDNIQLQGSGAYAWSGWTENKTGTGQDIGYSLPGHVTQATGQVILKPNRSNAWGSLGLTYLTRSGDAWDVERWPVEGTVYNNSNVGLVMGLGVTAFASGSLNFDISAESHLYQVDKVEAGFVVPGYEPFDSKGLQADLVVTVGIPISLIAR